MAPGPSALPPAQYHYARLLITPFSSSLPIDETTLLLLSSKILLEWFGCLGPSPGADLSVLHISPSTLPGPEGVREVVVRFPASAAMGILTALPMAASGWEGVEYRIRVLGSSEAVGELGGRMGEGAFGRWAAGLSVG